MIYSVEKAKRDATELDIDLKRVSGWFRQRKLIINTSKCENINSADGKAKDIEMMKSKSPNPRSTWVFILKIG